MRTIEGLSEFIDAYKIAIARVSGAPKPMDEFELLAGYPKLVHRSDIPVVTNVSKLRPMLVMDLVDCMLSDNQHDAALVFNRYHGLLGNLYKEDRYSLSKNVPIKTDISRADISDSMYFPSENAQGTLNQLLLHSYATNGDVFADETYEVLGPYHFGSFVTYVRRFHVENISQSGYVDFIIGGNGTVDIDMFGHANERITERWISIFRDNEFEDDGIDFKFDNRPQPSADEMYAIYLGRHGYHNGIKTSEHTYRRQRPLKNPQDLINFLESL